ncbi:hypothetical protein [Kitasatospora sp. NPDC088346]|uniref:hypothetical protein n=1 Tax=Kitasatospora sp. NPDC088346 TaxID=3364073 RepID=UPI0038019F6A
MTVHALPRSSALYLAAARAAEDAEQVRQVWRAAQAAGEPRWYLGLIARIGQAKAGAVARAAA